MQSGRIQDLSTKSANFIILELSEKPFEIKEF